MSSISGFVNDITFLALMLRFQCLSVCPSVCDGSALWSQGTMVITVENALYLKSGLC